MNNYKYQTTKGQFSRFQTEAKNDLELLYKVFVNETSNQIPIPKFQGLLRSFCRMNREHDFVRAVGKIKVFLTQKFA